MVNDGQYDVYGIIGDPSIFVSFLLSIYDTTGVLVYQTVDPASKWYGVDTATGTLSTKYKFYVEVKYITLGNIAYAQGTYAYLLSNRSTGIPGCVNMVPADTSKYEFQGQFDSAGFIPGSPSFEIYCN